jgi:hypothetical protein
LSIHPPHNEPYFVVNANFCRMPVHIEEHARRAIIEGHEQGCEATKHRRSDGKL